MDTINTTPTMVSVPVVKAARVNKTADTAKYMREYIRRRYHSDVAFARAYHNTQNAKRRYQVDDDMLARTGVHLHAVITAHEALATVPPALLEWFLENREQLTFAKKPREGAGSVGMSVTNVNGI